MKIIKHKKGQFIIFATLIIAIMIISIGTIMYSTVTYFKHERWQEYLMAIDNIELGSRRVVELSLANYTMLNGANNQTLVNNLNNWQINLTEAYPGLGVALTYSNATGSHYTYGVNINYSFGLASYWYNETSFSAANVTLHMDISSIGLKGYKFISAPFVKIEILSAVYSPLSQSLTIQLAVDKEGLIPITNLPESSFSLNVESPLGWESEDFSLSHYYNSGESINRFIYELYSEIPPPIPSAVSVTVIETRNIRVVANSTVFVQP